MIRSVGLLGCGRMGRPMGEHLLAAGVPLVVYDPVPEARRALVERGAAEGDGPADVAARSELVLVVVVDDSQAREAVESCLESAGPGTVIAICASVRPDTCRELAEQGRGRGVEVIDAAMVGGERGAEEGRLVLFCGGPPEIVEAIGPVLAPVSRALVHVGDVGAGQVVKTANNLLLWACIRADFEALRLGRALGVEPSRLREALALGSGANLPLAEWGEHRLRWPGKDLDVALAVAKEANVDMPFVEQLPRLMGELSVEDLHELL